MKEIYKNLFLSLMVLILLFITLEIIFGLMGYKPVEKSSDEPFYKYILDSCQFRPDKNLLVEDNNNVQRYKFTKGISKGNGTMMGDVSYYLMKNKTSVRIFFFGGSSANGYPLDFNNAFPEVFSDIFISNYKNISYEYVNFGQSCKDSFDLVNYFNEVKYFGPDVIVVYSGHNDFINFMNDAGKRSFLKRNPSILKLVFFLRDHSRLYSFLSHLNFNDRKNVTYIDEDIFNKNKKIILKNYENNIRYIVKESKKQGINVILITVVSNLQIDPRQVEITGKDVHLGNVDVDNFNLHFNKGLDYHKEGKFNEAFEEYETALKYDDKSALLYLLMAQIYEVYDDREMAYNYYVRAKDNDLVPNRAYSELNEILRQISMEENVGLLDMEYILRDGYIKYNQTIDCNYFGNERYCDELHPNERLHTIIAVNLYNKIKVK